MKILQIGKAFTLIEPGPVVFVTKNDGKKNNIMTISWTMVMDFTPKFAITTGPWNYSYAALRDSKECVIPIPTKDLLDTVVGVGICTGADTDKFETFGLTPMKARHVRAPLIKECQRETNRSRNWRWYICRGWANVEQKKNDEDKASGRHLVLCSHAIHA